MRGTHQNNASNGLLDAANMKRTLAADSFSGLPPVLEHIVELFPVSIPLFFPCYFRSLFDHLGMLTIFLRALAANFS